MKHDFPVTVNTAQAQIEKLLKRIFDMLEYIGCLIPVQDNVTDIKIRYEKTDNYFMIEKKR